MVTSVTGTSARPASATASRNRPTRFSTSPRATSIGAHPSAHSTACRVPIRPAEPDTMGGCGRWSGFGKVHTGSKSKNSPWNSASSSHQSARSAATHSASARYRAAQGIGRWSASSSSFQPTPTPNTTRPPDAWSRVATVFASAKRSCSNGSATPVARSSRSVAAAASARLMNGSIIRVYWAGISPPAG